MAVKNEMNPKELDLSKSAERKMAKAPKPMQPPPPAEKDDDDYEGGKGEVKVTVCIPTGGK